MKKQLIELAELLKKNKTKSSADSRRFLTILEKQNLVAAFGNNLSLNELCDFLEEEK